MHFHRLKLFHVHFKSFSQNHSPVPGNPSAQFATLLAANPSKSVRQRVNHSKKCNLVSERLALSAHHLGDHLTLSTHHLSGYLHPDFEPEARSRAPQVSLLRPEILTL
jgi:hypothetical protein